MSFLVLYTALCLLLVVCWAIEYIPAEGEDWGYVEVREGAFMFW